MCSRRVRRGNPPPIPSFRSPDSPEHSASRHQAERNDFDVEPCTQPIDSLLVNRVHAQPPGTQPHGERPRSHDLDVMMMLEQIVGLAGSAAIVASLADMRRQVFR